MWCLSFSQALTKARWHMMGSTGTPQRAVSVAPAANALCWVGLSFPSRDRSSAPAPAVWGRSPMARIPLILPSRVLAPPESPDAAPRQERLEEVGVEVRLRDFQGKWTHCLYKWIFLVSPVKRQVWLAIHLPGRTKSKQQTTIIMNPNQTQLSTILPLYNSSASAMSGLPIIPPALDRTINSRITGSRTMEVWRDHPSRPWRANRSMRHGSSSQLRRSTILQNWGPKRASQRCPIVLSNTTASPLTSARSVCMAFRGTEMWGLQQPRWQEAETPSMHLTSLSNWLLWSRPREDPWSHWPCPMLQVGTVAVNRPLLDLVGYTHHNFCNLKFNVIENKWI